MSKEVIKSQEEFIHKLEMEYLTHKLRSLVYRKMKYIKLSRDMALKKKEKIQALGVKFGIPTMFDTGVTKFVNEHFWNECGLPNFSYKDGEQKRVQGNYDAWYLLYRGTVIMYNGEPCTVVSNNPSTRTVQVLDGCFAMSYDEISLVNDYDWE